VVDLPPYRRQNGRFTPSDRPAWCQMIDPSEYLGQNDHFIPVGAPPAPQVLDVSGMGVHIRHPPVSDGRSRPAPGPAFIRCCGFRIRGA